MGKKTQFFHKNCIKCFQNVTKSLEILRNTSPTSKKVFFLQLWIHFSHPAVDVCPTGFRKLKNDFQIRLLISCQMTFPLVLFKEIYGHDFMIFYAALIMFSILLKRILEEEEKNKLQDSEAEIIEK